jgi:hypothetical protein
MDTMRHAAFVVVAASLIACAGEGSSPPGTCSMPDETADAGALTAAFAQRCNVPGSMGERKWYRAAATLPGTTNVVQVELYDNAGPFAGGAVHTGTFPVDADPVTCGVCVRALGEKGGANEMEYFATRGLVTLSALGASGTAFSVEVADLTLEQIDADHTLVPGGCTAAVAGAELDGTIMDHGGTGGGGGGGGGMGTGTCATTIGDAEKPQ